MVYLPIMHVVDSQRLKRLSRLLGLFISLCVVGCSGQSANERPAGPHAPKAVAPAAKAQNAEGTLFLMADIRGVLKTCGCTLELRKGGFDRLAPYLASERKVHKNSKLVHAGPLFYGDVHAKKNMEAQRQRRAEVVAQAVSHVHVDLAAVTAIDLVASKGKYDALVKKAKVKVTIANLAATESARAFPKYRIEKLGELRVGVFALVSNQTSDLLKKRFEVTDPVETARKIVAELGPRSDVIVLLSALGLRHTKRLVRKVPGIQFAVAGGLGEHPGVTDEAEKVGQTRVMQFHREGRFVGRLSMVVRNGSKDFVDASAPSKAELKVLDGRIAQLEKALKAWSTQRKAQDPAVRSARHTLASLKTERDRLNKPRPEPPKNRSYFSFRVTALPWDLPQDATLLSLMNAFDEELKQINLKHAPKLPKAKPGEAVYVGISNCMDCHEETQAYWKHDRHSHAWATLVKDNKTFDAECVSCHVTGYGKAGGSVVGQTKGRENVQCESCHGPGSIHSEAEEGQEKTTIVKSPPEAVCVT